MLESIRTLVDIPLCDEVLLAREDRLAARERRLLMQQARKQAKSCVALAQKEVEVIQASAFQEGYSRGLLRVADDLATLLLESRALATALQAELLQAARELLGDVLRDAQLLEGLLQRWQGLRNVQGGAVIQVILPLRCKSEIETLKGALKERGVERVDIQFHGEERYLFRLGDQVMEFDIGATQERLSSRLMAQIEQLPSSVRRLDQEARKVLAGWHDVLCDGPTHYPESNTHDEH
ncbi:oxygen-regulated invasion protein OrgB [Pseudomonas chlororaphis]|uniref:oxygen-regulated invasion protein OrgB n=1 Tax=Pseudomonas chlororaphis TaxID=587753 RepID=UPI0030CF79D8